MQSINSYVFFTTDLCFIFVTFNAKLRVSNFDKDHSNNEEVFIKYCFKFDSKSLISHYEEKKENFDNLELGSCILFNG